MQISFKVLGVRERPSESVRGVVQLSSGDWDDYSFKTSFGVTFYDFQGKRIDLGSVKIGYIGQPKGWTREKIPETFINLPEGWFSLGQDVEYYKTAVSQLSPDDRSLIVSDP